jgi:hypothetical protein
MGGPETACLSSILAEARPATPAIELEGNQLGELGRDVSHRVF